MQFAIIERFHCLTHSYVQSIHPRYPQKRGGTEKRKRKREREKKKEFERESERKKKQVVVIVARWQCGCIRLHRDTYRNELVYRRCVKAAKKAGPRPSFSRRPEWETPSRGGVLEGKRGWKGKSWKYWKKEITSTIDHSHFIIFPVLCSYLGLRSGYQRAINRPRWICLSAGSRNKIDDREKRRGIVNFLSFPPPLFLLDRFDLVANLSLCCRVRVIFS